MIVKRLTDSPLGYEVTGDVHHPGQTRQYPGEASIYVWPPDSYVHYQDRYPDKLLPLPWNPDTMPDIVPIPTTRTRLRRGQPPVTPPKTPRYRVASSGLDEMSDPDIYFQLQREGRIPRNALPPQDGDIFDFSLTEAEPPGLLEYGNIDIYNRPRVQNPDGAYSTLVSSVIGRPDGFYVIPTIGPRGERWSVDEAARTQAMSRRHLGRFQTQEQAADWAQRLHELSEKFYNYRGKTRPWVEWTNPKPGKSVPVNDPGLVELLIQG